MLPIELNERDEKVLRFLAERPLVADPKTVYYNISEGDGLSHSDVKNSLQKLLELGLLERPDRTPEGVSPRGMYLASEAGRAYVTGDVSLNDLREMLEDVDG